MPDYGLQKDNCRHDEAMSVRHQWERIIIELRTWQRNGYEQTPRVCDVLGCNGGYILSATHALTPDIPVENMMAMIEVAKE
jgi:uroporphyrinogen-III decarboxylase